MRDKQNLIRHMSVIIASAVLMLALILVAAVCGGMTAKEPPAESDYHFVPSLPPEGFDPSEWLSGMTMPNESGTWEPGTRETDTWDPGWDTLAPTTGFGTAPDWQTLPPEPNTAPDPEWPTLPDGWDTLPDEWDTLPSDWGDVTLPDIGDIGDVLAGMNGSLQNPAGALGAGVAAQLTIFRLMATDDDVVYFKMQSFGDYTGQGWAAAQACPDLMENRTYSADYLPSRGIRSTELGRPQYALWIDPVMQVQVIPYYAEATDGGPGTSDVLASGGIDEIARRVYTYRHYDFVNPAALNAETREFEQYYRQYVYKLYTNISNSEPRTEDIQYIDRIIAAEGFSATDPDIIEKVAAYVMQCGTYNLNYDKRLDSEENIALAFLGGYREGVCRHFATAATLIYRRLGIPARYTVGFRADVAGGAQVSWPSDGGVPTFSGGTWTDVKGADAHAWVEVYRDGVGWCYVEVTPPPAEDTRIDLTLTPVNVSRSYIPDTPLTPSSELRGFEKYAALGYTYEAIIHGERTEPGVNESVIQYIRIFDPDGKDVTSYFDLTLGTGRVQIYLAELTFASDSQERFYDGTDLFLEEDGCRLVEGALPDDGRVYHVKILSTGIQLHAGTSMATFRVQIFREEEAVDALGHAVARMVDVTDEFSIRRRYGTLTVLPTPISMAPADHEKVFDRTPLEATDELAYAVSLAMGDYIAELEVEGSQTSVGRSESNITHIVIRNQAGEDVTRNYRILLSPGVLRVLAEGNDKG